MYIKFELKTVHKKLRKKVVSRQKQIVNITRNFHISRTKNVIEMSRYTNNH